MKRFSLLTIGVVAMAIAESSGADPGTPPSNEWFTIDALFPPAIGLEDEASVYSGIELDGNGYKVDGDLIPGVYTSIPYFANVVVPQGIDPGFASKPEPDITNARVIQPPRTTLVPRLSSPAPAKD